MKYRNLGKTGLKVAEVGFGTWQLANDPNMWVGADLGESLKCLHKYVELGGNFIDTAWIYGYADEAPDRHPSEELIGKFLKEGGKRSELIIATKVAHKNWHWPALPEDKLEDCFPSDWIEKSVDDSLRSLGVDTLDLVQFHVWNDSWVERDEWKEMITKITRVGKVKFWGISTNDYQPSNCLKALDTGLISTVQTIFNVFHQEPAKELLPYAKEHNIGIIARVPLDEGGLSGKLTRDSKFAEGDFRRNYFKGERLGELAERVEKLKGLLDPNNISSVPELALRYLLSFDEVSTVIPGMRKLEHVVSNASVSDKGKLPESFMEELRNHVWERNFYN